MPAKAMRRPNGMGTAYKMKGRRRNPWVAKVATGKYKNGNIKYLCIGYYKTKGEAIEALNKYSVAPISEKASMTIKEVYEEWNDLHFKEISKSTADCYKAAWKYFEAIENVEMKQLRTAHIQKVIDLCVRMGRSYSTQKNISTLAIQLYKYAMQNDIVQKNYAEFAKVPKPERKEKEIFTAEEIQSLVDNDSIPYVDTILILIYTGLRINELFSLRLANIDIENQTIVGGIKTEAGKNRIIPIHPKIMGYVLRYYNRQIQGNFGKAKERVPFILNKQGSPMLPNHYRQAIYYPLLERLGIPKKTPHSCRHTFASLMAKYNDDIVATQKIIGHADYSTTANIYTHTDIEQLRKAVEKIS